MSKANAIQLGQNVKSSVVGNKLTLEIDLTEELGASGSGKNMMVAKTGGNKPVAAASGTYVVGLNVYKPID